MPDTYKLTYFPVTALGEPIRFLLAYGDMKYDDYRFERADWPSLKPSMPFGQVPVLEINGVKYHQSMAIVRYLAKKVTLYGKTDEQALKIDMIADTINDLRQKIGQYHYQEDAKIKENIKGPLFAETIPYYLKKLDGIVSENKGYFVDGELSYVDMYFVALLDYLNVMVAGTLIAGHSNLEKLAEKVRNIAAIKAWIEKRPKSDC